MTDDAGEGPLVEALTHRLSETPDEFLMPPGTINVAAIVCDHMRAIGFAEPSEAELGAFATPGSGEETVAYNRLRLIAIATWLLHDPALMARTDLADRVWSFLRTGLDGLATVVKAQTAVSDPDRREELARLLLKHLGLRPKGESEAQAADRLGSLDSVERKRVILATRQAEARAREVREMMAKKAAQEAAAKVSRE